MSAFPPLVQDWDTSQPLSKGTESEMVIEGDEEDECGAFEDVEDVGDNYIDQGEGADRRVLRRRLRSTYHRCLSNSNGLMACEAIALFRD